MKSVKRRGCGAGLVAPPPRRPGDVVAAGEASLAFVSPATVGAIRDL